MTTNNHIRSATTADAASILDIYSYYVENTVITFELIPPDLKEIEKRISDCLKSYEWIVSESDNRVVGYAYGSMFRERTAYKYCCETTVYVHHDFVGKGIGSELYRELLNRLRKSKISVAIGVIALPNDASVRLHRKLGFQSAGVLKNVGRKFRIWIDVEYWELELKAASEYIPEKNGLSY